MKVISRETKWQGRFIRAVVKKYLDKNGQERKWECVERTSSGKIVAIFAVTKEKELLLTKQLRWPFETFIVELPAGLTDKVGESLEETAKRELLEETGYQANKLMLINEGPFDSGLDNSVMVVYYAPDVEYVSKENVGSDDVEDIEVIKIKLSELVNFCTTKNVDFMVDLKILGMLKILESKGEI